MKSLRELIKDITNCSMTERELADAERRLYRFFRLLYEVQLEYEVKDVKYTCAINRVFDVDCT